MIFQNPGANKLRGLRVGYNPFAPGPGAFAYWYTNANVWALRAPWHTALFSEREGYNTGRSKRWSLGFNWRITSHPRV